MGILSCFSKEKKEKLDKGLEKTKESVFSKLARVVVGKSKVDDEVLVERLLKRGETSGRPDDANETVVRNRIKIYYAETAILKSYYSAKDKYFGVDGVGSVEDITVRLNTVINTL